MNKDKLQALANELAKDIKTPDDLSQLSAMLTKLTVKSALKSEMDFHLGYDRNAPAGHFSGNSRNGYSTKNLKGDHGEIEIKTPRDRNASFEPQLIKRDKPVLQEWMKKS
jgi:putative transposase